MQTVQNTFKYKFTKKPKKNKSNKNEIYMNDVIFSQINHFSPNIKKNIKSLNKIFKKP